MRSFLPRYKHTSPFVWLVSEWVVKLACPQVRRKGSYKGKKIGKSSDNDSFPMDACTLPGILLCFVIFLGARGLKPGQFQACLDVVKKLESKNCVSQVLKLLPSHRDFFINIQNNAIALEDLKEAVSQSQIPWARTVFFAEEISFPDGSHATDRRYRN